MLKFLVVSSLLFVAILSLPPPEGPRADPIVTTTVGQLRGKEVPNEYITSSENYLAFEGIPYAEPPTGDRRFRAPVPHAGWNGIRDAQELGNSCVQYVRGTRLITGDEDCLFLNVYTPSLEGKRPVMFYVHGGAFVNGAGDSIRFGDSTLMTEDVVVVKINYRMGLFGFLSTNDSFAPGNYGLKDMVEALHWVQRNIAAFSGDPDNVTIFGQSAGSVSVHMLVISPLTKGLFNRAIMESGTALACWGIQPDPRSHAVNLARNLGIDTRSSEAMLRGLRAVSAADLESLAPSRDDAIFPYGLSPVRYAPTVDPPDSLEPRFMPLTPIDMLRTRNFNDVPVIFGRNSDECLWNIDEPEGSIDRMNAFPNVWIPYYWNVTRGTPEAQEVIQSFRDTYFGGGDIEDIYNYTKFHTDHQFGWQISHSTELHVQTQSNPVYVYDFAYDGPMNYAKIGNGYSGVWPGAMHGDETFYIWKNALPDPVLPEDPAYTVRSRMIKMWTNFAKTGNPTPEVNSLIRVQWPKATSRMDFLRIDEELSIQQKPYEERMEMWRKYDSKYGPATDNSNSADRPIKIYANILTIFLSLSSVRLFRSQ